VRRRDTGGDEQLGDVVGALERARIAELDGSGVPVARPKCGRHADGTESALGGRKIRGGRQSMGGLAVTP
jgi:hypothetical protein